MLDTKLDTKIEEISKQKRRKDWLTEQLKDLATGNKIHPVKIRNRRTGRGVSLFLDHWDGSKHHYTFLKSALAGDKVLDMETIRRAVAARDEIERKISSGNLDEFDPKQDLLEIVKADISKSPNLARVLLHLKNYSEGKPIPLGKVTKKWWRGFRDYILSKVKNNSAASYLQILKAVIHRLQEDGWDGQPFVKENNLSYEPTDRTFLTGSEVEALAATPCHFPEVKRAFLFSCFAGLRISDVRKLKWGEIVKTDDGKYQAKFYQKKTKSFTFLPLSGEAARQLFFNQDEKIIQHPENLVFDLPGKSTAAACIPKWARQAGIKKHVSFHASRHTFFVFARKAGMDLYTVSELLGHASITTTLLYKHIDPERLRADVDKMPELSREAK